MLSEESVNNLVVDQMQLIKELRAENSALTEIVLKQTGLLNLSQTEDITVTQIPESMRSIGKVPWYMRQAQLEKIHRKPKLSELIGVSEQLELNLTD